MSQNIYDAWSSTINRITRSVARDFPDVSPEDLAQDLWVVVLENQWDNPDITGAVYVLRRVARATAMKYRTQQLSVSVQYAYRPSEVRKILAKVFDHQDWPTRSVPGFTHNGEHLPQWGLAEDDREGVEFVGQYNRLPRVEVKAEDAILVGAVSGPAADWDERMAGFSDVKRAWQLLPKQYKIAILKKYGLDQEPEGEAAERQLRRAVERLTAILNSYRSLG